MVPNHKKYQVISRYHTVQRRI